MRAAVAKVVGERVVVLGFGRALLLQMAHPLVAAAVDRHSRFRASAVAPYHRLLRTVRSMLALVLGDDARRATAARRIRAIHDRVHGALGPAAGAYAAGTPYSAHDRALLLWVHATLAQSLPLAYERLVGPLTPAERDAVVGEAAEIDEPIGLPPSDCPRDWASLSAYVDGMVEGGGLVVTDVARRIARTMLRPPLWWAFGPVGPLHRRLAVGTLPPRVRAMYGLPWTRRHEKNLHDWTRAVRRMRRVLPAGLARWPSAAAGASPDERVAPARARRLAAGAEAWTSAPRP